MATKKKSSGKKQQDEGLDPSIESFRASLEHTVTVSRERLQEVLDDAVERGRMTRRDAEGLISELLERGRKQRDFLIDELEKLGKHLGESSERIVREVRGAKPKSKAKSNSKAKFPIADYDDLNATQVRSQLAGLSAAQLRAVRDREQKGAARKTVLRDIEKKLK